MTLVELLVAMALSSLIAIAAVSALLVSRRGFAAVDAASQLRDNTRFAMDLVQRLALQAGFRDAAYAATLHPGEAPVDTEPGVGGFNNAAPVASDPAHKAGSHPAGPPGSAGHGSDVLVLRYQSSSTLRPGVSAAAAGVSDESMIDCAGNAAAAPARRSEQIVSVLHVATGPDGEPALMCTVATGAVASSAQPLVKGVESFQVLYGVDGVVAHVAPAAATPKTHLASRYLRADQMVVSGDEAATAANWRRVRSLRIGMVLRSSPNAGRMDGGDTFYPFGKTPSAAGGAPGSAFSSSSDPGTVLVRGADGRLRQAVTFTVHLRNEQDV